MQTTPGFPTDNWPVISGPGAGVTLAAPGAGRSHYVCGMICSTSVTVTVVNGTLSIPAGSHHFPHAVEVGENTALAISHAPISSVTTFGYTDKNMTP